jgi:hypothetical protein
MKNRRITNMSMTALALLMSCIMASAQAAEILVDSSILDQAMDVIGVKNTEAATIQEQINRLANSTSSTFEDFKRQNDALEALLVLNAGFRKSVSIQESNIATLDESIASVQSVTREIPLLMEKMLSSIEQFVELDYPFQVDERANRLQFARDAIDNPDVSIAEKFRQVLVIYQTESTYGRTNATYPDGIGRVALMYQSTDRQVTGAWDNNARQWVELPAGEYRTAVQTAIRVASNLDAPKIIELPVLAPEVAQ